MKEIVTFSMSFKVAGSWRTSREYNSVAELFAKSADYLQGLNQRFTNVTIVRNVRYEAVEGAQ